MLAMTLIWQCDAPHAIFYVYRSAIQGRTKVPKSAFFLGFFVVMVAKNRKTID